LPFQVCKERRDFKPERKTECEREATKLLAINKDAVKRPNIIEASFLRGTVPPLMLTIWRGISTDTGDPKSQNSQRIKRRKKVPSHGRGSQDSTKVREKHSNGVLASKDKGKKRAKQRL